MTYSGTIDRWKMSQFNPIYCDLMLSSAALKSTLAWIEFKMTATDDKMKDSIFTYKHPWRAREYDEVMLIGFKNVYKGSTATFFFYQYAKLTTKWATDSRFKQTEMRVWSEPRDVIWLSVWQYRYCIVSDSTAASAVNKSLSPAHMQEFTLTRLCSGLPRLSSRARQVRVDRGDFLCKAGTRDRNSELVSNSIDLLFGVAVSGWTTPLPLLRSITMSTPAPSYKRINDGRSVTTALQCI